MAYRDDRTTADNVDDMALTMKLRRVFKATSMSRNILRLYALEKMVDLS